MSARLSIPRREEARGRADQLGGVTVTPTATYEGRCWGGRRAEAFKTGAFDASDVRDVLQPMMLAPGEDRTNIGDVFSSVYDQCIEFVTARIGEEMLLDGPTSAASDDYRQPRELAALFC